MGEGVDADKVAGGALGASPVLALFALASWALPMLGRG